MTSIYGLSDPRTGCLRYIGQTKDPRKRYSRHCNVAASERTHRATWLRGLKAAGLKPVFEVLEVVDDTLASDSEAFWIGALRSAGANLCNHTAGGEGGATRSGRRHTQETKDKIRAAHLGMRPSLESRLRMSETRRGKKQARETVEKRAARLRGLSWSAERKSQLSETMKEWHRKRRQGDAIGFPGFNKTVDVDRFHTTRRGDSGPHVSYLQRKLKDVPLGDPYRDAPLNADGDFGPMTEAAVRAAQAIVGIPQTGIVDVATFALLAWRQVGSATNP